MRYVIPVLVAAVLILAAAAVTQTVRFNCVDLGFYKSCGVSTVK
jgi:hypothetical protein